MYTENEILFPQHLIVSLKHCRGEKFQALVQKVLTLSPYHAENVAFMMMMVRLNGCMLCETDSFRAMRGCLPCVLQTLKRFKGTDDELLNLYHKTLSEVHQYALAHPQLGIVTDSSVHFETFKSRAV